MSNSKALYTEEVFLPSKGLLTPSVPEGRVVLRCMEVSDEKFMKGSKLNAELTIRTLLKRCVVEPKDFDPDKIHKQDLLYLLTKLRILSYNQYYSFVLKCPECGTKLEILDYDISQMTVNTLDEDYEKEMYVELPRKGDTVYTRLLVVNEEDAIAEETMRLLKKFPDMEGDPSVSLDVARRITRIEPKDKSQEVLTDPVDILRYVEELTVLDMTAIQSTWEDILIGISPLIDVECDTCNSVSEVAINFSGDFFRPKYKRKSKRTNVSTVHTV